MQASDDDLIPTRASLIGRLKDWQDPASWQRFFDTYWKLIYGVARQAGLTDTEAQDVVQETMLSVARHMPGFKYDPAHGSFKAWLLNMTRWRIIDQLRARRKGASHSAGPDATATTAVAPEERAVDPSGNALDAVWDAEWQTALLEAAVARVRRRVEPQNYLIFDCYVNKEWPAEKVAESFAVPVSHVYLAKHRVTELLKEEVARLEHEVV